MEEADSSAVQWHFKISLNHKQQILFRSEFSDMILKESVKNILVRYPYTNGKIGLPRPKYDIYTNFKICNGKYSIELIDAENRENVKKFMLGENWKKYNTVSNF